MGRAKLAMEFIKKDKARAATFEKRKKGLKKKAYELATLCDVPLCVIIYPGPNSEPDTYPSSQAEVRTVIDRYMSIPEEENAKRSLGLQEALEGKKSKVDHHLPSFKVQTKASMPTWFNDFDGLSRDQLAKLAFDLDHKLCAVEERIGDLRGSFGIYSNNAIVNTCNGCESCDANMQMPWPMFDPAAGGSSSGAGGVSSAGFSYNPNDQFTGSNLYHGQVGPSNEKSGFGGGPVVAQPTTFYGGGGGVRFEPRQMDGGGGAVKWFDESQFFL